MITKPILAATIKDVTKLRFPLLVSPKLDGIRCLRPHGMAPVTRNFKPIPNRFIQEELTKILPEGIDGEILIKGGEFNDVQSKVMSFEGEPDFEFWAFDLVQIVGGGLHFPFSSRFQRLSDAHVRHPSPRIKVVPHYRCADLASLERYEALFLDEGFEGLMARHPNAPYKLGRSTFKEHYLLKLKRFAESEGTVIGFSEKFHNANKLEQDAFGHAKRSSAQDNLVPMNTLGALKVQFNGFTFNIGTGFDDSQRQFIWDNKPKHIGLKVTFKHQKSGAKDKPRFPVFKCFRRDL